MVNIPAQLIIGSYIFNKLLEEEKNKFKLYKVYNFVTNFDWAGDNYFYDKEDLLEFWGVRNLEDINGSVYVRDFKNLTRVEEELWKSLSLNGSQIKIFWC